MPLRDVGRATTSRAAETLGIDGELRTLRPGSVADIALFRLLEGRFPLSDIWGAMRESDRLLANTMTNVMTTSRPRITQPLVVASKLPKAFCTSKAASEVPNASQNTPSRQTGRR